MGAGQSLASKAWGAVKSKVGGLWDGLKAKAGALKNKVAAGAKGLLAKAQALGGKACRRPRASPTRSAARSAA